MKPKTATPATYLNILLCFIIIVFFNDYKVTFNPTENVLLNGYAFPLYSSPPPIVSGSNILVSEVPVHKFSPDTNMRNLDTANFLVRDTGRVYPN